VQVLRPRHARFWGETKVAPSSLSKGGGKHSNPHRCHIGLTEGKLGASSRQSLSHRRVGDKIFRWRSLQPCANDCNFRCTRVPTRRCQTE